MVDESNRLYPVFKRIDLGNPVDAEKARLAIQKYSGRVAIVKNMHIVNDTDLYIIGVLRADPNDKFCYHLNFITGGEKMKNTNVFISIKTEKENEIKMWYNDLEELIVNNSMP